MGAANQHACAQPAAARWAESTATSLFSPQTAGIIGLSPGSSALPGPAPLLTPFFRIQTADRSRPAACACRTSSVWRVLRPPKLRWAGHPHRRTIVVFAGERSASGRADRGLGAEQLPAQPVGRQPSKDGHDSDAVEHLDPTAAIAIVSLGSTHAIKATSTRCTYELPFGLNTGSAAPSPDAWRHGIPKCGGGGRGSARRHVGSPRAASPDRHAVKSGMGSGEQGSMPE